LCLYGVDRIAEEMLDRQILLSHLKNNSICRRLLWMVAMVIPGGSNKVGEEDLMPADCLYFRIPS
jgi:hypothetical protein